MDLKRGVGLLLIMMLLLVTGAVAAITVHHSQSDATLPHASNGRRNVLEREERPSMQSMERDVAALLSFKKHIISDPSRKLSNWTAQNSAEVCSTWYGITCTRHTTRVVAIKLPQELQLGGTLSSSLGALSFLKTLNLSGNNFTGRIPPEFGQLKALRVLDLSSNNLVGSIPKLLSNCTRLLWIDLSWNRFTGTMPTEFGRLLQLEHVNFADSGISGRIPEELGLLQKLKTLDLSYNGNLGGTIPSALGNCSSLKLLHLDELRLSENLLTGNLTSIEFPRNLCYFSAHSNYFFGTLPSSLANSSCQLLDLRKNQLEGEISEHIGNFQELRVLSIAYNKFHGYIPQSITNLTKLQVLDLSNNRFSGRIPSDFHRLQGFILNPSSEQDGLVIPSDIMIVIKGVEYTLEYVLGTNVIMDLSNNNLTGEIPASIGNLSSLRLLNLSGNHLEGRIPTSLSHISALEQMDLARNNLSGTIPQELSKLSMLEVLDVSSNSLCGPIPSGTQFSTFSVASFQKNKCLWGCPLDPCNGNKRPLRKDNNGKSGKSNNVKMSWLSHVDEKMSLLTLGMGFGIGFGGVVAMFMLWERAKHWVLCLPHKKSNTFYGEYRFPA